MPASGTQICLHIGRKEMLWILESGVALLKSCGFVVVDESYVTGSFYMDKCARMRRALYFREYFVITT
jgi:hypothetical protein